MTYFFSLIFFFLLSYSCLLAQQYDTARAFPNLRFNYPVELVHSGDGTNRLFVLEKIGIVRVFENRYDVAVADTFLAITPKVATTVGGDEQGLLGIAFHPDYEKNGYFYVNYTAANPRRTIIAQYSVDPNNPNRANSTSEVILLQMYLPPTRTNHNAGRLQFGPDGYLYISVGDGGGPATVSQRLDTLLGKILRIDVNKSEKGKNYAIPPDNPFAGNQNGTMEEIWAWGFRNPWKFSFDPVKNWLWLADVGAEQWEEVNIIKKSKNYGWPVMEGKHCFSSSSGCDTTGKEKPIWEYSHDTITGGGRSITGGYAYYGSALPGLAGKYIYGDWATGRVWALEYDGAASPINTLLLQRKVLGISLSAFGVDQNNELLMCGIGDGRIYRIRQLPSNSTNNSVANTPFSLHQPKPNPANEQVVIPFSLESTTSISIAIFDAAGREVQRVFDGEREAGDHEIAFDSSTLPAGTYFCRLTDGIRTATENVVVE